MSLLAWFPLIKDGINQGLTTNNFNFNSKCTFNDNSGKLGGGYLKIDDSGRQSVVIDGLSNAKQVTLAFWFKELEETVAAWNDFIMIYAHYENGETVKDNEMRLENFNDSSTKKPGVNWYCNVFNKSYSPSASNNYAISLGNSFSSGINEWHHAVLEIDFEKHNWKCWFDGKFTQGSEINPYATRLNGTLYLGDISITCGLTDVRIYDHLLSQEEINDLANGLVLHYALNNGYGGENLMQADGVSKSGCTSYSYDNVTNTYTIESPAKSNSWGYGIACKQVHTMSVPWGSDYRFSAEVYVPTSHVVTIDINNGVETGTAWAGNDNDEVNKRTSQSFAIPANKWTKIVWGGRNSHDKNTNKVDIFPYDKIGLVTTNDTESTTWYLRNLKMELGSITSQWSPNSADASYSELGYDDVTEYDMSGYGNNGIKVNSPVSMSDSPTGYGSYEFNASKKQYIKCGRGAMVTDAITVNIWAYADDWSTFTSRLVSCTEAGGWNFEPINKYMNFTLYAENFGYLVNFTSQVPLSGLTGWHMFTGTFDGIYKRIYLDGKLKAETNVAQTDSKTITEKTKIHYNATNAIFIGAEAGNDQNTPFGSYFTGRLSDLRIYATALSSDDIRKLYEVKEMVDKNGNLYCNNFIETNQEDEIIDYTEDDIVPFNNYKNSSAGSVTRLDKDRFSIISNEKFIGILINKDLFVPNEVIKLSFCAKKFSGTLINLRGHCDSFKSLLMLIDGKVINGSYGSSNDNKDILNNDKVHYIEVYLKYLDTTENIIKDLFIQPNRNITSSVGVEIFGITLNKISSSDNILINNIKFNDDSTINCNKFVELNNNKFFANKTSNIIANQIIET